MLKKYYSTSFNLLNNNKFDNNYADKCGGYKTKGLFKKNQPDINLPLFSIITVVYNNVSQIKRCMDSVFNQTYENIEYIVIDGGSTDGTLDLIKEDEGKLDLWISEKDDGIYDAINKGINFSNGFTLMLHSDDQLYDKNTLERVSRCIKNQSTLYFGKVENYNEYVKWRSRICSRSLTSLADSLVLILVINNFENHSKAYWYVGSTLAKSAIQKYNICE